MIELSIELKELSNRELLMKKTFIYNQIASLDRKTRHFDETNITSRKNQLTLLYGYIVREIHRRKSLAKVNINSSNTYTKVR